MFVEPIDSEPSSLNSSAKQVDADEVPVDSSIHNIESEQTAAEESEMALAKNVAVLEPPLAQSEENTTVKVEVRPELSASDASAVTANEGELQSIITETEAESAIPNADSPTEVNVVVTEEAPLTEAGSSAPEPPTEPARPHFEEYMTKASEAKSKATDWFKKGDYDLAKINYMTALETLQYVQGDLNNKQKSVLFEQTVACNNNVALCCLNTDDLQNAVAFATNSLLLIRSLEKNIPDSIIWMCLQENGVTTEQLQRQWKRKALYYIGKAQLKRKNFKEAVVHLEEAHALIAEDPTMAKHAAEHKTLLTDARNRLGKEKQREKDTWAKAFQKGKTEVESMYHNPRDTPTSSAPDTPTRAEPVDPNNLKFDLSDLGGGKDSKKKKAKKEAQSSTALTTWPPGGFYYTAFFLSLFAVIGGGLYFKSRRW